MTQPTDKVREVFEACHQWMNLAKKPMGEYVFVSAQDCYNSFCAGMSEGRTAALNEQSAEIERLQSLLQQGEAQPVAWMMEWVGHSPSLTTDRTDYLQHERDLLVPLYRHPPAPKLVTAEDVTDEMVKAMQTKLFTEGVNDKDIMVFAVNAFNGMEGGK